MEILSVCVMLLLSGQLIRAESSALYLQTSGFLPPKPDDVALLFFVTIKNKGFSPITDLAVSMERCCLFSLDTQDQDCQIMHLLGEARHMLYPNSRVNMTLTYPTKYTYDRLGECHVILTDAGGATIQNTIPFDTRLSQSDWMPAFMQDWVLGVDKCSSEDQDRLRGCQPVNCILKYDGMKNYYNTTAKRCQRVTPCISDPNSALPNKAYNRRQNKCKTLGESLTEEDQGYFKQELHSGPFEEFNLTHLYQLVCVNGKELENGTGCTCQEGWRTAPLSDPTSYNPTTRMVYMCNVRDVNYVEALRHHKVLAAMICLAALCVILMLVLCAVFCYDACVHHRIDLPCGVKESTSLESARLSKNVSPISSSFAELHASVAPPKPVGSKGSFFKYARVHIPNTPSMDGELELEMGDVIFDLEQTNQPGIWAGSCNGKDGVFPVSCAQFYTDMSQQTE